jgi:hypothetical protein
VVASPPQQPSEPSHAAQWEQAVRDGDRAKIEALGRRGPGETPEKDTYVKFDDLPEDVRPTADRPPLTVWWSEERVSEYVRIQLRAFHHFKIDPTNLNSYPKHAELKTYFEGVRLSNGQLISPNQATYLATFCRPVDAMKRGRW